MIKDIIPLLSVFVIYKLFSLKMGLLLKGNKTVKSENGSEWLFDSWKISLERQIVYPVFYDKTQRNTVDFMAICKKLNLFNRSKFVRFLIRSLGLDPILANIILLN